MTSSMHPVSIQKPSTVVLPSGEWTTILASLCNLFPHVSQSEWESRFARGLILDDQNQPLGRDSLYRAGMKIYYYRENPQEEPIPGQVTLIYADEHLLVVDKPPFLPVIPSGKYVTQTLLGRLVNLYGNTELQPLHRIDRHTSGLVMFSSQKQSRGLYQALFRDNKVKKRYQALAPPLPQLKLPYHYQSRIVRGEPFFLSMEIAGPVNAHTIIDVLEKKEALWRYSLTPVSGKKHQLRLHMCALGAPILHDFFYPVVIDEQLDNYMKPLQLLAYELQFVDPLTGGIRHFTSQQRLAWPAAT